MNKSKNSSKQNKDKLCECCGKEHDHTYGSGRFCSEKCKIEFVANKARNTNNPKVKAHLDKLRADGKVSARAPYGTWKCNKCKLIFDTRAQLKAHIIKIHSMAYNKSSIENGKYICCYCGKKYDSPR